MLNSVFTYNTAKEAMSVKKKGEVDPMAVVLVC